MAIQLRDVGFAVDGREILRDVSFEVPEGEVFALVGPSGCGKTTTLRLISGLYHPTRGSVEVYGRDAASYSGCERNVATVWQSRALFPHMSVRDNIEFGLRLRGVPRSERRRSVQQVVDRIDLRSLLDRPVGRLSGGEQQRVALARAIIVRPRVLLLDEPYTGLDRPLRLQLQSDLRNLLEEGGRTYVIVSHEIDDVLSLASQMAVLHEGRVVEIGTTRQIYLSPARAFTAEFLGALNVIPGIIRSHKEGGTIAQVDTGYGSTWDGSNIHHAAVGDRVAYAINPQDLQIGAGGACRIQVTYHGNEWIGGRESSFFRLSSGNEVRVAIAPGREVAKFSVGQQMVISWETAQALVLKY